MIGFAAGIAAALDFGFARVKELVQELTPEQLEAVPAGFSNSIATLLVHVYGFEGQVGYGLRGQQVPEAVKSELLLNLPRTQTLPEVKGQTAQSLLAKMEKAHGLLLSGLAEITEADLDRELPMGPGRTIPIRRLLSLLPQHQGQHYGHMQLLRRTLG